MLGLSLVVVHKLLIAVASLVVDHGLYGARASIIVVPGLSCSVAEGLFLDQGLNPCSLQWQADS